MSSKFSHRKTRVQHKPKVCISAPPKYRYVPRPPIPPLPPSSYGYWGYEGDENLPYLSDCAHAIGVPGLIPTIILGVFRGIHNIDFDLLQIGGGRYGGGITQDGVIYTSTLECLNNDWTSDFSATYLGDTFWARWIGARGTYTPFHLAFPSIIGQTADFF